MTYGAVLYHKDRTSDGGLSAYINPLYNVPSGYISTPIEGFPVPHPDFIDLEDGRGHGFLKKSRSIRVQQKDISSIARTQSLVSNEPRSTTYA